MVLGTSMRVFTTPPTLHEYKCYTFANQKVLASLGSESSGMLIQLGHGTPEGGRRQGQHRRVTERVCLIYHTILETEAETDDSSWGMSARWPPLSHVGDCDFFRQRCHKESRARESAQLSPSSSPRHRSTPVAAHISPQLSPRVAFDVAFARPVVSTRTILPPRTQAHADALREMGRTTWHEPPLVMAHAFSGHPPTFRSYVEASAHSGSNPMVPCLPWSPRFASVY
jgi:hypothetical protein